MREGGPFASYSAARRMRRGVTASSHLASASVSGPAAPSASRTPVRARDFPRRELADCAQHRLHREPGRGLSRGCRRGSTQARSEWHSRHRKPLTAFPLCSPPESQLVSHASLRGQRRVGLRKLAEYPGHLHRVTQCDHIVDRDSALLAGRHGVHSGPGLLE
jgi:hypothetical protein